MKLSPLQIKHYHFTSMSVICRPDIDLDKFDYSSGPYPSTEDANIQTDVALGEPDDSDQHQFVVFLTISCTPQEGSNFPYSFSTSLEGVFSISHEGDMDERRRIVVRNGASVLYSAAREQILTLTTRQKYGPILLPTVNFSGLEQEKQDSEAPSN